jgi:Tol biopolymer transport system component
MDADGKNRKQITREPYDHEDPAWSPDGKKVAFVSLKDDLEVIYLMNPDGTGLEPLTRPDARVITRTGPRTGRGSPTARTTI